MKSGKQVLAKAPLSLAVLLALGGVSPLLQAQQSQADAEVETIAVKGFRQSLLKNRDFKRDALVSQDSIVAEDIADFPDLNLADSLQRIPGIAITREGGEGRQISVRGLGPDFTRVELNGMDVLATSGTSMDSRGQGNRSRGFDFNVFASELFSQIDVKKSFSASMDEGGIAGTVALRPAKPFDYQGFNGAVSAQLGTNSLTEDTSPRLATVLSNTWDNFGALFSLAYSERDTMEKGYNTYRFRPLTASGADISALPEATQALINSKALKFARGNRLSVWENQQERLGMTTSLQYKASDALSFDLDLLYSELNNKKDEHHLASRGGAGSTALGGAITAGGVSVPGSVVKALEYDQDNYVVYGEFDNVAMATESRRQEMDTSFHQLSLTTHWQLADHTQLEFLLGTSGNSFDVPVSDKIYYEGFGGIITDYRNGFDAVNTYLFDVTDMTNWAMHEVDLDESYQDSGFDTVRLAFSSSLDDSQSLSYGASSKKFTNEGRAYQRADLLKTDFEKGTTEDALSADYYQLFTGFAGQSWAGADVAKALAYYNLDANLTDAHLLANGTFELEENTDALWLDYNWQGDAVRANLGARYVQTEVTSKGKAQVDGSMTDLEVVQDYQKLLPAANLVWDLTDDLLWRSSISQNLTRPSLGSLAISGSVNTDRLEISSGNPGLKPYESTNYETGLEWYYSDAGYLSAAVFYKQIDNFVISQRRQVAYKDTGFSTALLAAGQTGDTLFYYNSPVNAQSTDIRGLELGAQRDFDFLPAPWNQLGMVGNYTYADGDMDYYDGETYLATKPFSGLSKNSANLTFYYETELWGARLSGAYRSDYVVSITPQSEEEDESGFHSTLNLDFSAFYQWNERLKLSLEISNISNEREEQYTDSSDHLYNVTETGRTYYLGLSYKL